MTAFFSLEDSYLSHGSAAGGTGMFHTEAAAWVTSFKLTGDTTWTHSASGWHFHFGTWNWRWGGRLGQVQRFYVQKLDLRISRVPLVPQAEKAKAEPWILFLWYFNYYLGKKTSWFNGNLVVEERLYLGPPHLLALCFGGSYHCQSTELPLWSVREDHIPCLQPWMVLSSQATA